MFWAYCVQNKTKIETEHSGATYQMSRLEDMGLVCLQFPCSFPACLLKQSYSLGWALLREEGDGPVGGKTGSLELLSSCNFPLT